MNPILIIPFILAPLVTVMVTYLAMYSGLVAKITGVALPWTTPPFISGFLATSHWSGTAIQVVNFFITAAIYYPFFKIWDDKKLQEESEMENSN